MDLVKLIIRRPIHTATPYQHISFSKAKKEKPTKAETSTPTTPNPYDKNPPTPPRTAQPRPPKHPPNAPVRNSSVQQTPPPSSLYQACRGYSTPPPGHSRNSQSRSPSPIPPCLVLVFVLVLEGVGTGADAGVGVEVDFEVVVDSDGGRYGTIESSLRLADGRNERDETER